jgi:type III secretion protein L
MSSNVIKAKSLAEAMPGPTLKRAVHDADQEAARIVRDAREQAAQILATAKAERDAALKSARDDGYTAGLSEWNQTLARTWKAADDFLSRYESELVRLAIRIAGKVVDAELKTDERTILGIVKRAVESARRERSLIIRINPEHETVVQEWIDAMRSSSFQERNISLAVNPDIPVGGCIVESDIGIIDARLEAQLQRLEEALLARSK